MFALDTVAVAALVLAALLLGLFLASARRSIETRARSRIAVEAESIAEELLAREGFRVLDRQVQGRLSMIVDGEEVAIDVRVDLVVQRDGRRMIAEVKSGALAPDVRHGPTRRQLLEYALAFGDGEILLVDVPARAVRSVSFPIDARRRSAERPR